MDTMPVDIPEDTDASLFDAPPGASWARMPAPQRAAGEVLRYRGLSLDLATGEALLGERAVALSARERLLLTALMQRAGQIVSVSWLAKQVGCVESDLAAAARSLAVALSRAGKCCLPRRVEGLGYILWR